MNFDDHGHVDGLAQTELDRLAARARTALEWRRRVEAMEGTGEVDGVRATVNGSGSLTDLRVAASAVTDGGDAVAERISAAVAAARADVARVVARSGAETFGEDSTEAATIRRTWEGAAQARATVVRPADTPAPPDRPRDGTPPPSPPAAGTW
ncbi:YbaB/EbfC family nucleoid-associated protein [uncultured Phycicoccus sp.]|uniref:YbaB/EbfC family nucleoid-associated protein n=1 Tax=uncultured Phycicoccus sp. TaxID=661422 RepID=UPI002635C24E|nr:YbaB/EbfC family nucleoid-associated protein [uncultured Phycicoccus sp.]